MCLTVVEAFVYCTFALTDALPVRVNVQLAVLLAVVQAPVQNAVRPPETLRVTAPFAGNEADPVLPTGTLIPAGLEVTLTPLRPLAVTVSTAVAAAGGGGFRVKPADRVTPPPETEMLPCVRTVTAAV